MSWSYLECALGTQHMHGEHKKREEEKGVEVSTLLLLKHYLAVHTFQSQTDVRSGQRPSCAETHRWTFGVSLKETYCCKKTTIVYCMWIKYGLKCM